MEDWKQKLVDAVRPYVRRKDLTGYRHLRDLGDWLLNRKLNNLDEITSPQHVVELMELIDQWHDDDVAKQPCAPPEQPTNPFIVERIEREIKRGNYGHFVITEVKADSVVLRTVPATYTPKALRALAKQLTDLADAHEAVYPPNHCAAAC
ncbi:hypothetical protein [Aquamicrobium zhengzhouense]|uniref:Uncharacterized protein n=1 Tax=Aquamicrobium zhengzhouense TaxID=2781738 RepID=A0ABS0S9U7_9HYPH|nr:hypothetical protein [Aquamicrobium zhengzhouense]MBI1620068.1 hypothetical protein [Aquamicrobium zhengzhouense]